jgi:hypothetical protein
MKKSPLIVILLVGVLINAACGSGSEATLSPTPAQAEVTAEAQSDFTSTPTAESPPTFSLRAPTLPASWTPTGTQTPTETPTLTPSPEPVVVATANPACEPFRVDFEITQREINLGETLTVGWTPVEGAGLYRVFVYDITLQDLRLKEELLESNALAYTFAQDVFPRAGRYGWEVQPLDTVGIQMCLGVGEGVIIED